MYEGDIPLFAEKYPDVTLISTTAGQYREYWSENPTPSNRYRYYTTWTKNATNGNHSVTYAPHLENLTWKQNYTYATNNPAENWNNGTYNIKSLVFTIDPSSSASKGIYFGHYVLTNMSNAEYIQIGELGVCYFGTGGYIAHTNGPTSSTVFVAYAQNYTSKVGWLSGPAIPITVYHYLTGEFLYRRNNLNHSASASAYTHWGISNQLTNVTTNNDVDRVEAGTSYTATITANAGYALDSVQILMGSTDITEDSYNPSTGIITIESVTEVVQIIATAI